MVICYLNENKFTFFLYKMSMTTLTELSISNKHSALLKFNGKEMTCLGHKVLEHNTVR